MPSTWTARRPPPPASASRSGRGISWSQRLIQCGRAERLREFVTGHRRDEYRYVTKSLKDLRQVIDAFINTLRSAFAEDQEADAQVSVMLAGLKKAVQGNSIEALKRGVLSAVASIAQVIEERRKRHGTQMEKLGAELKAMRVELTEARHEMELDPLTRLYNRSSFQQTLARTVELSRFSGQPACLLMVDADHFKQVNDVHGHPAGDQVLRRLADCCMRTFLRQTDFVSRYGGEEFAVILTNTGISVGRRLADRLLRAVRALTVEHQGQTIRVTISIGIAELAPGENDERWLARTDAALYQAKSLGRDRVVEAAAGEG